jgi:GTPase SAR1 family protein
MGILLVYDVTDQKSFDSMSPEYGCLNTSQRYTIFCAC